MHRTLIFIPSVLVIAPASLSAQDFVIRIEAVGYLDSTEAKPKEELLWSIETPARPGASFSRTITSGNDKLELSGRIRWTSRESTSNTITSLPSALLSRTADRPIPLLQGESRALLQARSARGSCLAGATAPRDRLESRKGGAVIGCT